MRDCEKCKHRVMKVEVGKGTSPEHFWGCECWECEFEPTTKNDLGVDLISRADVLKLMQDNWHTHNGDWAMQESMDDIRALPSVTPQEPRKITLEDVKGYCKPRCLTIITNELLYELTHPKIKALEQEPKTGHWNDVPKYKDIAWQCSECRHFTTMKHNYCPNCGAKMVEPQESEDKE